MKTEIIDYDDVKVGDIISAKPGVGPYHHFLVFQDGFKIDLSPAVMVGEVNGVMMAGGVSLLSFKNKIILKHFE
jgi:hypothetical protein